MEAPTAATLPEATAEAVRAGEKVATSGRFKPVSVDHPGWLTARIEDTRSGEVEGVYIQGGQLIFSKLGRGSDGEIKCYTVRERELKKIVRAMIGDPSDDLVREAVANWRNRPSNGRPRRRLRRKQ